MHCSKTWDENNGECCLKIMNPNPLVTLSFQKVYGEKNARKIQRKTPQPAHILFFFPLKEHTHAFTIRMSSLIKGNFQELFMSGTVGCFCNKPVSEVKSQSRENHKDLHPLSHISHTHSYLLLRDRNHPDVCAHSALCGMCTCSFLAI